MTQEDTRPVSPPEPRPRNVSEVCSHPLARTVWRGDEQVWCWACRTAEDAPRLLSEPEAWMVIQRWRALDGGSL